MARPPLPDTGRGYGFWSVCVDRTAGPSIFHHGSGLRIKRGWAADGGYRCGYRRAHWDRLADAGFGGPPLDRVRKLWCSDRRLSDTFGTDGENAAAMAFGVLLFGLGIGNATSLPPLMAQVEFQEADVSRVVPLIVALS